MKFIYIDSEGNQIGPSEQPAVERAIEEGAVTTETAIRNSLLGEYRTVRDFPCFKEVLERVAAAQRAAAGEPEPEEGAGGTELSGWPALLASAKSDLSYEKSSIFEHRAKPCNASVMRRCSALFSDISVLFLVGAAIFGTAFFFAARRGDIVMTKPDTEAIDLNFAAKQEAKLAELGKAPAAPGSAAAPAAGEADKPIQKAIPALDRVVNMNRTRNREIAGDAAKRTPAPAPASAATVPAPAAGEPAADSAADAGAAEVSGTDPLLTFQLWTFEVRNAEAYRALLRHGMWLFVPIVLLYYALGYGIWAQSPGMYFMGMFVCRRDAGEVSYFRALVYTFLSIVFGILMIPMVMVSGRSLADWLCGVRVINVYSAPSD